MLDSRQLPYILAGMLLMTLQPVLVMLSKNESGKLEYSSVSSTLLSELLKIVISSCLYALSPPPQKVKFDTRKTLEYAAPAAIYFVNNNLVFAILSRVSATTFQLLSQLKTVFTGLLFRFFLGRKLSTFQYLAIWQLACGTAVSQVPECLNVSATASEQHDSVIGLLFAVVSCLLSAFGGVYSEKLLKDQPKDSIHWQNIQLYAWGILFNMVGMLVNNSGAVAERGFFDGYNMWACVVVVNNALNGLAISAILKYADNIARVYAHACAMLLTMVLSVLLFGQPPTPQLIIACSVVGASTIQYNTKSEQATPQGQMQDTKKTSIEDMEELKQMVDNGDGKNPMRDRV